MRTLITRWLARHITGPLDAMYARLDENQDDGSYAPDPNFRSVADPKPDWERGSSTEMARSDFNLRHLRERV